jgi:3-phosphoshikimate 1-carboxyvinyltransferase
MQVSHPTKSFSGITLELPSSKSINNRVLIIKNLCNEHFEILHPSNSADTQILTNVLNKSILDKEIDINNAGTCMRFLTAFLSTQKGDYTLTGSKRMQERPIEILAETLNSIGAKISYKSNKGYPPLEIIGGKTKGGKTSIKGDVSSQYISALLMIAPSLDNGLELEITGEILSIPYIQMTLNMLSYFGIEYQFKNNTISISKQEYKAKDIIIEPDWSGVSYIYAIVAASKNASIQLNNFTENSIQGDSVTKDIYAKLGVKTTFNSKGMLIEKVPSTLPVQFNYDFSKCPDIAQTVACSLSQLDIPFKLTGLKTLRIKETDRIAALQNELTKLGYHIIIDQEDNLIWDGEINKINSKANIETYDDHRMAMAFTPLCMKHEIEIEEPEVVVKSYPDFWKDMKMLGFQLDE